MNAREARRLAKGKQEKVAIDIDPYYTVPDEVYSNIEHASRNGIRLTTVEVTDWDANKIHSLIYALKREGYKAYLTHDDCSDYEGSWDTPKDYIEIRW